jgi:hypothetical protein
MKRIKISLIFLFSVFIFFNLIFLNKSSSANPQEIPPDTYYCWYDVEPGVGFIRICYACNIFPFAYPAGYDGMCWNP